ncbi:MAG: ROK family protein [Comamonadaceae bacterium]|nr:MAG: ROK family protein [Comamonadaceae bacterium]
MASKDKKDEDGSTRKKADRLSDKELKAQRDLCVLGPHGELALPSVSIDGYSLELREGDEFVGDNASRTAFRHMLDAWRKLYTDMAGKDPMGSKPTQEIGKQRLDELLERDGPAAAAIRAAQDDYALQLAHVTKRFLKHKTWKGVKRVIVGGGFHQSEVGEQAINAAAKLLAKDKVPVELRTLHHHADDGGLVGWVHLAPTALLQSYDAILAVDIGGTNVRCGIVVTHLHKTPDMSKAEVVRREKWGHASEDPKRDELVGGIVDMLEKLLAYADKHGIRVAPFIGVACPGLICEDGSIAGGTQNLPGNWESMRFHLPRDLCDRLPTIGDGRTQVCLHNDAVVQGLSELPFTQDVKRWAVLTVGTGLGNATYTNAETTKTTSAAK